MADIKFSCPHCNQHITCDELWSGHQIQCPSCQGSLAVPSRPAPAPAPAPAAGASPVSHEPGSLVPSVPQSSAPKLSIGHSKPASAAAASHQAPARPIPIRNLAPPAPKKENRLLQIAKVAGVLIVAGVSGYFGFKWVQGYEAKANEKSRAEESRSGSDGGQVGHIMALNNVLDATDPSGPGLGSLGHHRATGPVDRGGGSSREIGIPNNPGDAPPTAGAENLPVIPPVWVSDLASAKIPEGRANGTISGGNFVVDTARVDPVGGAQVLQLVQGQPAAPDREILIYFHLKPGETLAGQSLSISPDMHGAGVPTVSKRWKPDPRFAPKIESFNSGYVMKIEMAQASNGAIPGRILLALPDSDKSVVGGAFRVTAEAAGMNARYAPQPVMRPVPTAARSAVHDRYGIQ